MSFLEKADDWHELRPEGQTLIFNGVLCDYWPEIKAVIEAAQQVEASDPGQENWAKLGNALDALDKKAES